MPALRWFGRPCGVAADDMVFSGVVFSVLRFIQLAITGGLTVAILVGLNRAEECSPDPYALFVFFVFGTIVLLLLILTTEWGKFVVSRNGAIVKNRGPEKRDLGISVALTARALLGVVEIAFNVIGWFVVSKVINDNKCPSEVQGSTVAIAVMLLISALIWAANFVIIWDPVGCYSKGFIAHMTLSDGRGDNTAEGHAEAQYVSVHRRTWRTLWLKEEELVVDESQKSLYNTSASVWLLRLKAITGFTFLRQFELESSLSAIAKDLAVLFDSNTFGGLTPSDIAAALFLVKSKQTVAGDKWLKHMLQVMESKHLRESDNQVLSSPYVYKSPEPFNGSKETDRKLLTDAVYYFDYAIGMYGWKMYCFEKPFTGWFGLARQTRSHWCCCQCNGPQQSYYEPTAHELGDCGCSTASLALYARISKEHVLGGSTKNELFRAPFCVVADEEKQAIVIVIRGTMSFKDALTDLSVSMLQLDFPHDPQLHGLNTQVHKGMFWTAMNILNQILQEDMLTRYPEYRSIIVVGHSLGGGVASIIALLLKTYFSDHIKRCNVQCFAFSPPGCVFSYALAEYSREFVSTFVCGEDIVPCLNWRSLLYLKHNIRKELEDCDHPKYKVFYGAFLPNCLSPEAYTYTENEATGTLDQCDLTEENYQSLGFFKPSFQPERANMLYYISLAKKFGDKWKRKAITTTAMPEDMTDGPEPTPSRSLGVSTYTPAFIPGRVLHIEVQTKTSCCSLSPRYERYTMNWKRNEDFSLLTLGAKSLQNHLPNVFRNTIRAAAEQAFAEFHRPPPNSRLESKPYSDVTIPMSEITTTSNKPVLQQAGAQVSGSEAGEIELENANCAPPECGLDS